MKAEREIGTRRIRFTGIPGDVPAMTIEIGYISEMETLMNAFDGIALDNEIIPRIVNAINNDGTIVAMIPAAYDPKAACCPMGDHLVQLDTTGYCQYCGYDLQHPG